MKLPENLRKRGGLLEIKKGGEWYRWNPFRSKLAAYLLAGGENWPFNKDSNVLYLGAAEGNTISFLSDICMYGRIIGVDISSVAMAEFLVLVEKKTNVIPFLGDAQLPEKYLPHVGKANILYQDIAQSNQIEIFIRNYDFFKPECGFLMLKSRSTPGKEKEVFRLAKTKLKLRFDNLEVINISKWAKGHTAYFIS